MTTKNHKSSNRYPRIVRVISLILLTTFTFNEAAHAAPAGILSAGAMQNPSAIQLSSSFAKISDVYQGTSPHFLIHIQDAHTNTGGERNIAKALEELITRYHIKTVFIEGGTKDDSLDFLRPLASLQKREEVAKKYLMRGELNGAEYLSLASDYDFKIWGVEDGGLYDKNLKSYADVAAKREAVLSYIGEMQKRVQSLKRRMYTKDILAFDDFIEKFNKKEKDFTEYYSFLSGYADKYGINLLGFPHFLSLKELKNREEKIDFKKANIQQQTLAGLLSETDLAEHAEKLKAGTLSPLPFYETMMARAKEKKINLAAYPDFTAYVDYLKLWSATKMDRFLAETKVLEEIIYQKGLNEDDSFYLHRLSGYLTVLNSLFSLQASREEFDDYSLRQKDVRFSTGVCLGFINRKLYDFGNYTEVLPVKSLIDDNKNKIEDFYRTTEDRDEVFLNKSIQKMEAGNIGSAVLITGGFHTQSLMQRMKDRNISYAVVTPVVTEETNLKRYEQILLSRKGLAPALTVSSNSSKTGDQDQVMPIEAAEVTSLMGSLMTNLTSGSFEEGAPGSGRNAGEPLFNLAAARLAAEQDLESISAKTQSAVDEKDRWSPNDLAVISRNVLDWLAADDAIVPQAHKQTILSLIRSGDAVKLKGGFLNAEGIQWPGTAGFRGPMENLAEGKIGPNYIGEVTMRQYADIYRSYLADQARTGKLSANPYAIVAGEVRLNTEFYTTLLAQGIAEAGVRVIRHADPTHRPVSTPLTSHAAQYFASQLGSAPAAVLMNSASHNGLSDTGVKIGDKTGCQLLPDQVAEIKPYKKLLSQIKPFESEASLRARGMIRDVTPAEYDGLLNSYFDATEKALQPDFKAVIQKAVAGGMKFVTTPLNGATAAETERFLTERLGLKKDADFFVPADEEVLPLTDRTHPAWSYKDFDPARKGILDKTIAFAESKGVSMVLARDLDGDRLVIAMKIGGEWKLLDGNQNGIVILENKLAALKAEGKTADISNFVLMRSHVTSPLHDAIARDFGVREENIGVVPVGFKYFGSVVKQKLGAWGRLYFGAEESYGLSIGVDPEKDSLSGLVSMLLVAAKAHDAAKTPYDELMRIYEQYGYTGDITTKFDIQGGNPAERNSNKAKTLSALDALKAGDVINGRFSVEKTDHQFKAPIYSDEVLQDGYRFYLKDINTGRNILLIIRASGTEPVFKYSFFWVDPMKPGSGQSAQDVVRFTAAYLTEPGGIGQSIENFFRDSWKSAARLALPVGFLPVAKKQIDAALEGMKALEAEGMSLNLADVSEMIQFMFRKMRVGTFKGMQPGTALQLVSDSEGLRIYLEQNSDEGRDLTAASQDSRFREYFRNLVFGFVQGNVAYISEVTSYIRNFEIKSPKDSTVFFDKKSKLTKLAGEVKDFNQGALFDYMQQFGGKPWSVEERIGSKVLKFATDAALSFKREEALPNIIGKLRGALKTVKEWPSLNQNAEGGRIQEQIDRFLEELNAVSRGARLALDQSEISLAQLQEKISALDSISLPVEKLNKVFSLIDEYSSLAGEAAVKQEILSLSRYFDLSEEEIRAYSLSEAAGESMFAFKYVLYRNLLRGMTPIVSSDLSGTLADFTRKIFYPGVQDFVIDALKDGPLVVTTGDPQSTVVTNLISPLSALSVDSTNLTVLPLLGLEYRSGLQNFERVSLVEGISEKQFSEIEGLMRTVLARHEQSLNQRMSALTNGRFGAITPYFEKRESAEVAGQKRYAMAFLPLGKINDPALKDIVKNDKKDDASIQSQLYRLTGEINQELGSLGLPQNAVKGGSTTLDYNPSDKGRALIAAMAKMGLDSERNYFVFLGDNTVPGGNDWAAVATPGAAVLAVMLGAKKPVLDTLPAGHHLVYAPAQDGQLRTAEFGNAIVHVRRLAAAYGFPVAAARLAGESVDEISLIASLNRSGRNSKQKTIAVNQEVLQTVSAMYDPIGRFRLSKWLAEKSANQAAVKNYEGYYGFKAAFNASFPVRGLQVSDGMIRTIEGNDIRSYSVPNRNAETDGLTVGAGTRRRTLTSQGTGGPIVRADFSLDGDVFGFSRRLTAPVIYRNESQANVFGQSEDIPNASHFAVSGDGKKVLYEAHRGSNVRVFYLRDLESGKRTRVGLPGGLFSDLIVQSKLSYDGKMAAFVVTPDEASQYTETRVYIVDLQAQTGEGSGDAIEITFPGIGAAFSRDGLVAVRQQDQVLIYDLKKKKERQFIPIWQSNAGESQLVFSPDSQTLVVADTGTTDGDNPSAILTRNDLEQKEFSKTEIYVLLDGLLVGDLDINHSSMADFIDYFWAYAAGPFETLYSQVPANMIEALRSRANAVTASSGRIRTVLGDYVSTSPFPQAQREYIVELMKLFEKNEDISLNEFVTRSRNLAARMNPAFPRRYLIPILARAVYITPEGARMANERPAAARLAVMSDAKAVEIRAQLAEAARVGKENNVWRPNLKAVRVYFSGYLAGEAALTNGELANPTALFDQVISTLPNLTGWKDLDKHRVSATDIGIAIQRIAPEKKKKSSGARLADDQRWDRFFNRAQKSLAGSVRLGLDGIRQDISAGRFLDALNKIDVLIGNPAFSDAGAQASLKTLKSGVFSYSFRPTFVKSEYDKLSALLQENILADEPAATALKRERILARALVYFQTKDYGPFYTTLKRLDEWGTISPDKREAYEAIMNNIGIFARKRLESSTQYEIGAYRSNGIENLVIANLGKPEVDGKLELPNGLVAPPVSMGRVSAYHDDLPFMLRDMRGPVETLVGAEGIISSKQEKLDKQFSKDNLFIVAELAEGGLSMRGAIYTDTGFFVADLGLIYLGDLRHSQISQKLKTDFKGGWEAVAESDFTAGRVDRILDPARRRANLEVDKMIRVRSTLTPRWNRKTGKVYLPYSPDGLGVASHGDLSLNPVLFGKFGDLLARAEELGIPKENIYVSPHNLNVPNSRPSAKMIASFHRIRTELKRQGLPAPISAFQLVPNSGDDGGVLAMVNGKLMVAETFLLSKEKREEIKRNKTLYPGFNTNYGASALEDFIDALFSGTNITEKDITSDALFGKRATFHRVLAAINGKMRIIGTAEDFLKADLATQIPTYIEEKGDLAQVSTMHNYLATYTGSNGKYAPAHYFIQPRGLEPESDLGTGASLGRSFYAEIKKIEQEGNLAHIARGYFNRGWVDNLPGRQGKIVADTDDVIDQILERFSRIVNLNKQKGIQVSLQNARVELADPGNPDKAFEFHAGSVAEVNMNYVLSNFLYKKLSPLDLKYDHVTVVYDHASNQLTITLRAGTAGARLAAPSRKGPFSGIAVYENILRFLDEDSKIKNIAFGKKMIAAAGVRAVEGERAKYEYLLAQLPIDAGHQYQISIQSLPGIGKTLALMDAGARLATGEKLSPLQKAVSEIQDWKKINAATMEEPSRDNPFITRLQEKAQKLFSAYSLHRLSYKERKEFIEAVFDVQNYKTINTQLQSIYSAFVKDPGASTPLDAVQYQRLGQRFSVFEQDYTISEYHNIRAAIALLFDFFQNEVNNLEQVQVIAEIDKELEKPGSGNLQTVAAIQDIHNGYRRLAALVGFVMGFPADAYRDISSMDDFKHFIIIHNINPSILNLRIIGLADQYDRGPDPVAVAELVQWIRVQNKAKTFLGNHDFWRAMGVLQVHRIFQERDVDYNDAENKGHHVAYWAEEAFAHTGWGDIELDQVNQENFNHSVDRLNQIIRIINQSLPAEEKIAEFEKIDLRAVRDKFDVDLKAKKTRNAEIRKLKQASPGDPSVQSIPLLTLPDIFEETLKFTRESVAAYNERIAQINDRHKGRGVNLSPIAIKVADLENYHEDPAVIQRTLNDLKNFRLFYVDLYGNLHMHNIVPVKPEGGFDVSYGGREGLEALELMSQRVREFFEPYDTIPTDKVFRDHMWEKLGDIFEIVNSWYSDKPGYVYAKAENVQKFINDGGLAKFGSGILGHATQTFAPRKVTGFMILGHNERKKFKELDVPYIYPYPELGSAIVNIDYELSPGYSDRGAIMTVFKRDENGLITGLRLWGFKKGSSVIEDLTFDDVKGLDGKQLDEIKRLHDGVNFMKWYRLKSLNSMKDNLQVLIMQAEAARRFDKAAAFRKDLAAVEARLRELTAVAPSEVRPVTPSDVLSKIDSGDLSGAVQLLTKHRHEIPQADLESIANKIKSAYTGPIKIVGKVGGTTISFEASSADGLLGHRVTVQTNAEGDTEQAVVDRIAKAIDSVIGFYGDPNRVQGVYFTAPGFFDLEGKLTEKEANIPGLNRAGFSFKDSVSEALAKLITRNEALGAIPVTVVHDGTGAALGEISVFGTRANETKSNLFFIIAGTGIGTRRLVDGKPFFGGPEVNYLINEIPHLLLFNGHPEAPDFRFFGLETKGVPVYTDRTLADGNENPRYVGPDLEDRTSGPSIAAYAQSEVNRISAPSESSVERAAASELLLLARNDLNKIDTKLLGIAANKGNSLAVRVISERAKELGVGIAAAILVYKNQYDVAPPDHVIIGSGVAQIGPVFLQAVREGAQRHFAQSGFSFDTQRIVLSEILDDTAREFLGGLATKEEMAAYGLELQKLSTGARLAAAPSQVPVRGSVVSDVFGRSAVETIRINPAQAAARLGAANAGKLGPKKTSYPLLVSELARLEVVTIGLALDQGAIAVTFEGAQQGAAPFSFYQGQFAEALAGTFDGSRTPLFAAKAARQQLLSRYVGVWNDSKEAKTVWSGVQQQLTDVKTTSELVAVLPLSLISSTVDFENTVARYNQMAAAQKMKLTIQIATQGQAVPPGVAALIKKISSGLTTHRFIDIEIFESTQGTLFNDAVQSVIAKKGGAERLSTGATKILVFAHGSTADDITGQIGSTDGVTGRMRSNVFLAGVQTPEKSSPVSFATVFIASVYRALDQLNAIPTPGAFDYEMKEIKGLGFVMIFRFNLNKALEDLRLAKQAEIAA